MNFTEDIFSEITDTVISLTQQIENLQQKIDALCKSTGNCDFIKKAHEDLIPRKELADGINIDTFCEKK